MANETLQELNQDISRLVQLAHPAESSSFLVHVGVDSFITALNDRELEVEFLKLEPQTLPDAVSHAIRLESLAESVSARSHTNADQTSGRVQNHPRRILAVTDGNKDKDENADLQQRVAQLEQQLKQANQGGTRNAQSSSKNSNSKRGRGRKSADQNSVALATGAENRPNAQKNPCNYRVRPKKTPPTKISLFSEEFNIFW